MQTEEITDYLLYNHLKEWCDNNSLIINTLKIFSNKRSIPNSHSITIGTPLIEQVDTYKYLGTTIPKELNFDENTKAIIRKAEKKPFIPKLPAKLKVEHQLSSYAIKHS